MAQATKLYDLSAPVAAPPPRPLPPRALASVDVGEPSQIEAPRKLVRPRLPEHMAEPAKAPRRLRGAAPLARHEGHAPAPPRAATSAAGQAESFYFQKQMQTQTPMVFVLEDGESIQGVVEWFDRDTIKVRNATRTLIFKRSIKYLYKAEGAG